MHVHEPQHGETWGRVARPRQTRRLILDEPEHGGGEKVRARPFGAIELALPILWAGGGRSPGAVR